MTVRYSVYNHMYNDNVFNPSHDVLLKHRRTFSVRLIPPRYNTERHRKSFLAVAIEPFYFAIKSVCLFGDILN